MALESKDILYFTHANINFSLHIQQNTKLLGIVFKVVSMVQKHHSTTFILQIFGEEKIIVKKRFYVIKVEDKNKTTKNISTLKYDSSEKYNFV